MKTKYMNQSLNRLNFIARAIDPKLLFESLRSLPKHSIIVHYIEAHVLLNLLNEQRKFSDTLVQEQVCDMAFRIL